MAEAFEEPPEDRSAFDAVTKANGACENFDEGKDNNFDATVYASHAAYLDARWTLLRDLLTERQGYFWLFREDGRQIRTQEVRDASNIDLYKGDAAIQAQCVLVEELLEARKGK